MLVRPQQAKSAAGASSRGRRPTPAVIAGPVMDKHAFSRHGGRWKLQHCGYDMDDEAAEISSVRVLIGAVQHGSQAALKRLYEMEARRLYGVALRIVRRPEIAADVLQDGFIQVWQNAGSFSADRGDASAWLTAIIRYRALDAVRKLRREVLSDDPALGETSDATDVMQDIDKKLAEGALRRCLGLLDDTQRRCVVFAFIEGLSHAEIAARLPAPLGSVKSWIRRGLLALRSCLEP